MNYFVMLFFNFFSGHFILYMEMKKENVEGGGMLCLYFGKLRVKVTSNLKNVIPC